MGTPFSVSKNFPPPPRVIARSEATRQSYVKYFEFAEIH